jgi:hypothetical protein
LALGPPDALAANDVAAALLWATGADGAQARGKARALGNELEREDGASAACRRLATELGLA